MAYRAKWRTRAHRALTIAPPAALRWAPPAGYGSFTLMQLGNASARVIELAADTDYRVVLTERIDESRDGYAGFRFNGGRNIVLIGGRITVNDQGDTTLTSTLAASDTTINVAATTDAGFTTPGRVRINGDHWEYTGKTATTLTGATRTDNVIPPGTTPPHASGSTVYPSENTRQALYFSHPTGTVHVEGLLLDGVDISEGIQVFGEGCTVQVQNVRCGPISARDQTSFTDNHPDLLQIRGDTLALRVDRFTGWTDYQGFLLGNTSPLEVVPTIDIRHTNLEGAASLTSNLPRGYLLKHKGSERLNLENVWVYPSPHKPGLGCDPPSDPRYQAVRFGRPPGGDFVAAEDVGVDYVSPGYLS